jgi:hypothetical protein
MMAIAPKAGVRAGKSAAFTAQEDAALKLQQYILRQRALRLANQASEIAREARQVAREAEEGWGDQGPLE